MDHGARSRAMPAVADEVRGPAQQVRAHPKLEHDPEKWIPVFGKDHAPVIRQSGMTIRRKVILL
jgi:hypothetical protein